MRVTVEDLGVVARAEVDLAPLTLLVGENGTGKTWLATAIWALHQLPTPLFQRPELAAEREVAARWLATLGPEPTPMPPEVLAAAAAAVERLSGAIVDGAFSGMMGSTARLRISGAAPRMVRSEGNVVHVEAPPGRLAVTRPGSDAEAAVLRVAAAGTLQGGDWSDPFWNVARFFPASRSGLLATLPSVAERAIAGVLPPLTEPVRQFVRWLLDLQATPVSRRREDLAELVEQALGGRVHQEGPSQFLFESRAAGRALELRHASSHVSELAPLARMLRTGVPRLLVYEEPEAHLHPRVQRVVARVLVRLARSGATVVVTTHSDLFVQQINNHLKLGALERPPGLPAPGELPYDGEDALTPAEVSAYELRRRPDGRTEAVGLEKRADGVVWTSFNDAVTALAEEAVALDDAREPGA